MVLSPYDFEVVWGGVMPYLSAMLMDGLGFLQVFIESFSKGPGGLPYVYIIIC